MRSIYSFYLSIIFLLFWGIFSSAQHLRRFGHFIRSPNPPSPLFGQCPKFCTFFLKPSLRFLKFQQVDWVSLLCCFETLGNKMGYFCHQYKVRNNFESMIIKIHNFFYCAFPVFKLFNSAQFWGHFEPLWLNMVIFWTQMSYFRHWYEARNHFYSILV